MSKKHSFPSRISKNNLFWLNLPTNYLRGNIRFFDKKHGLTPLENVIFLDLFKTTLFLLKNHSFLSRISKKNLFWLNFSKKYPWENIQFLDKKYNLFGKFWTFLKIHFSGLKSILFYPEYRKTILSCLICLINTYEKTFRFSQKPWTNPFGKFRFFWLF